MHFRLSLARPFLQPASSPSRSHSQQPPIQTPSPSDPDNPRCLPPAFTAVDACLATNHPYGHRPLWLVPPPGGLNDKSVSSHHLELQKDEPAMPTEPSPSPSAWSAVAGDLTFPVMSSHSLHQQFLNENYFACCANCNQSNCWQRTSARDTRQLATHTTPWATIQNVLAAQQYLHPFALDSTPIRLAPANNALSPNNPPTRAPFRGIVPIQATTSSSSPAQLQLQLPNASETRQLIRELLLLQNSSSTSGLSLTGRYGARLFHIVSSILAFSALRRTTASDPKQQLEDLSRSFITDDLDVLLSEICVDEQFCDAGRSVALGLLLRASLLAGGIGALARTSEATQRQVQNALFRLLLEMMERILIMENSRTVDNKMVSSKPSANSSTETSYHDGGRATTHFWVERATDCIAHFVKSYDQPDLERCRMINPQALFLLLDSANCAFETHETLVELVTLTMVADSSKKQQEQPPVGVRDLCTASPISLTRHEDIEMLLFHFHTVPSLDLRRRLLSVLLVFFYLKQCSGDAPSASASSSLTPKESSDDFTALRTLLNEWDLASLITSFPFLFTEAYLPRLVKKLVGFATSHDRPFLSPKCSGRVDEKRLVALLRDFCKMLQLEEYFVQSVQLTVTTRLARSQAKNNDSTDLLINKVVSLLDSTSSVDRFRGERWLAELLNLGLDLNGTLDKTGRLTSNSSNSKTSDGLAKVTKSGDESNNTSGAEGMADLESTLCVDEATETRMAARSRFWELSRSSSTTNRLSFVRTLQCFLKRKLRPKFKHVYPSVLREINTCLGVLVDQNESNVQILVEAILTVLQVCVRGVPYEDSQRQERDAHDSSLPNGAWHSQILASSDCIAAHVLRGDVSLDLELVQEISPEFLLHSLGKLEQATHPRVKCQRFCCGYGSGIVGDVFACTAFVAQLVFRDQPTFLKVGGIGSFIPLLDSCDTRVSHFFAQLIISKIKQSSVSQYYEMLRKIHAEVAQDDDDAVLTTPYLHARALLLKHLSVN